jgi:hypothetical protein
LRKSGQSGSGVLKTGLIAALFALLAACASPVPQPVVDEVASEEDLLRIFARLGAGFGKDDNAEAWVRKWISPVRVSLVNQRSSDDVRAVREALQKIQPITGIPFEFPPKTGAKNFIVRFVKLKDLKKEILKRYGNMRELELPKGTICFALPRGRNNIAFADIFIAADSGNKLRDICMLHEMMHAYGLIGHHQAYGPSILYYRDIKQQHYSVNDRLLLRTLYDPTISPGMPRVEALKVANKLIPAFREKLLLDVPEDEVLTQPLQW